MIIVRTILLSLVHFAPSLAFTTSFTTSLPQTTRMTSLKYNIEDAAEAAEPLPMTLEDLKFLSEMKTREETIPIILMEALLPSQTIKFSSSDPNFREMIQYVLSVKSDEIGIIGFNPTSGAPLNVGVTSVIDKDTLSLYINKNNPTEQTIAAYLKGQRCFEVIGDPWMDETKSFYLANVEITDNRKELSSQESEERAMELYNKIPQQVDECLDLILKTKRASKSELKKLLNDIGPMPSSDSYSPQERANWVGSLLNPTQGFDNEICPEIRPAMLSCRNDHDRMALTSVALQSSIDYLSKK